MMKYDVDINLVMKQYSSDIQHQNNVHPKTVL